MENAKEVVCVEIRYDTREETITRFQAMNIEQGWRDGERTEKRTG